MSEVGTLSRAGLRIWALAVLGQASMLHAQTMPIEPRADTSASQEGSSNRPGDTARSSIGVVGRRQSTEQTKLIAKPMARLNSRLSNRIENRLRNRVDSAYRGDADAGSQAREADARGRRTSPKM